MKATHGLSNGIPYSSHISPEIVKLKGGSYMMCFRLRGVQHLGMAQTTIDNRVIQINKFISGLKAPLRYNVFIQCHYIKGEGNASLPNDFEGDFLRGLNQSYEDKIINGIPIVSSDYYISVIYRPYRRYLGKAFITLTKKKIAAHEAAAREYLAQIKNEVLSFFAGYDVEVLGCYEKDGNTYSDVLRFLGRLVNLDNSNPVPIQKAQISEYLATGTLTMGSNEIIRFDNFGRTKYGAFLTFAQYPDETTAGKCREFLELPWQMIVTQSFAPIDKSEAKGWLDREYGRMEAGDEASASDLQDILDASEGVKSDNFVMGHFYWSALILDDSIEALRNKLSKAAQTISSCGFTSSVHKHGKLHCYYAQLPGNLDKQPRVARLSSANVSQMMPFECNYAGKKDGNPWGEALAMFRTKNDDVSYFNFQPTDEGQNNFGEKLPGNTIISGKTGTGKTVLLSFLLAQSQRFKVKPRLVVFDKLLGSSVFIKALGGKYSQVKLGEPTGFNPFSLPNNKATVSFLTLLMTTLCEMRGNPLIQREVREIEEAVKQTLGYNASHRNIESFWNLLPGGDNSVRERLYPYVLGEYGWIFNNEEDTFSFEGNTVFGIDYTDFLEIPEISTPVLMYLFHRIEALIDGHPIIISLDEAWAPLSDRKFEKFIEKKQREIRKENGVLILTTQSPKDFFQGVSPAIIEQTSTHIFLPNPEADPQILIDKLKMTEDMTKKIIEMGEHSRQFIVRQGKNYSHNVLNLRGCREVDVMSGSEERARIADDLIKEHGEDWLEHYYQAISAQKTQEKAA